jgi:high-affinity Fe2+/Pb2+ permease
VNLVLALAVAILVGFAIAWVAVKLVVEDER